MAVPSYSGTFTTLSTLAGSLSMTAPTAESATTASTFTPAANGSNSVGWRHTGATANMLVGAGYTFPAPLDFSSKKYISFILAYYANFNQLSNTASLSDGGLRVVFIDGVGNFARYHIHGGNIPINQQKAYSFTTYKPFPFFIDRSAAPDALLGVIDWSDVVRVEIYIKAKSSGTYNFDITMYNLSICDEPIVKAGQSGNYASFIGLPPLYPHYDGGTKFFFETVGGWMGSNTKTYVVQNGCHIGDDVTETHFRDSNVNLSFYATKRSFINTNFAGDFGWGCCVYAEDRGFKLRLTPASTLAITNMVFSGVDYAGGDYSVDLSGDGSKTFNIGAVYRATKFIVGNSSLNRFAFYDCYEIDIDSTSAITESSVESSKSTGKGVYFSGGPDDYSAIQIRMSGGANDQITVSGSSAGPYVLGGITATNSVNFHNESATNAVTILLASGVSYTTSTAGGAVTIETPPVVVSITALDSTTKSPIIGAAVYIEAGAGGSLAQGTVIINDVTDSSGVVTTSVTAPSNQPIQKGSIRSASGSPHYTAYPFEGTISSVSGLTLTALLINEDS